MRLTAMAAAGFLALAALAACGQQGDTEGSGEATPTGASSSATTGGDDTTSPESPGDEPTSGAMTLTGTVSNGVEPGCPMLEADGVKYQLVGDKAKDLKEGAKVTVTGKLMENSMSTCMEGKPFEVESVKAA